MHTTAKPGNSTRALPFTGSGGVRAQGAAQCVCLGSQKIPISTLQLMPTFGTIKIKRRNNKIIGMARGAPHGDTCIANGVVSNNSITDK